MDIVGLGPEIVNQLYESGLVRELADLYELELAQLLRLERFAEAKAKSLLAAIAASKENALYRLIYALGIPLVGLETSKILARNFPDMAALAAADVGSLMALDQIGALIAQEVVGFFANDTNRAQLRRLAELGLNMRSEREAQALEQTPCWEDFCADGDAPDLFPRRSEGADRGARRQGHGKRQQENELSGGRRKAGFKIRQGGEPGHSGA